MATRKKIALIFSYNENWIGGTYYIQNLVHAFNILPEEQKPHITICTFSYKDYQYIVSETSYPFISFFLMPTLSIYKKVFNFFSKRIFKRKIFKHNKKKLLKNLYDAIFPNPREQCFDLIDNSKKIYWIPDFQENHLPEFFSMREIANRKEDQLKISLLPSKVVLSSNDAKKDFDLLYPLALCEKYIIPFAVTHPSYDYIEFEQLRKKYSISRSYFYVPNQFWVHKNHQIVLDSVLLLKEKNINITVLFSGKETDYRNKDYFNNLKSFVLEHGLQENILFLGFINRAEMLVLMKNAEAIIQPSLFEGWSTVVEDAKAMNQFIICSNIAVHREQLTQNVLFFDPKEKVSLTNHIINIIKNGKTIEQNNYDPYVLKFAETFMSIID